MRLPDAAAQPARARGAIGSDAPDGIGTTVYDVARDLRRDVAEVGFPLDIEGSAEAEASRERLLIQLDEHLLPRLKELSSPAVVVIAGSTGAGKSTLYNSLLGEEVSAAGVLRPTTRQPVFAYNPADAEVLVHGPTTALARVVEHEAVPRGIAMLDAPDLDSLIAENRETATLLLEAADLWLFVTTAARYGDALPWATLKRAMERGASVAMVLNRVPKENLTTIRADLANRLREHDMSGAPLFVIPDVGPHEGLLDPKDTAPIARWMSMLAGPDRSRSIVVRTLKGALGALPSWVSHVASEVEAQISAAEALRTGVTRVVPEAEDEARSVILAGRTAHGSLAARWGQVASASGMDRVKVRGGVARSTRRRGRQRDEAMAPLYDEAITAAVRMLVAAGVLGEDAALGALENPVIPGAGSILPDHEKVVGRRESDAREHAGQWAELADRAAAALANEGRAGEGAARSFGGHGLAALLLTAAAGLDEASRLVESTLGEPGLEAVDSLRTELADHAAFMVRQEARDLLAALERPELAADADSGLRLRLAELRRLM